MISTEEIQAIKDAISDGTILYSDTLWEGDGKL